MKNLFKLLAAACASAVLASPALADGSYIAIDLGRTTAKDACSSAGLPAGTVIAGCSETATAFRVAGGMQFDPTLGMEISYANYGQASLGTAYIPGFAPLVGGDWSLTGFEIAATGTFPVNDTVSVLGKLGLATTTIDLVGAGLSSSSTNLAFGIGAQFNVAPNLALRAQYENLGTVGDAAITGTAKVSLLTAGLVYKF